MKKIIILVGLLLILPFSKMFSLPACWQIKVTVMGGWESITVYPNGRVELECGNCSDKVCYEVNEDGSYRIGEKCTADIYFFWLNCPPNPSVPNQNFGLARATFLGFLNPSNPASGLIFQIEENTIRFNDYNSWCQCSHENQVVFGIGRPND